MVAPRVQRGHLVPFLIIIITVLNPIRHTVALIRQTRWNVSQIHEKYFTCPFGKEAIDSLRKGEAS